MEKSMIDFTECYGNFMEGTMSRTQVPTKDPAVHQLLQELTQRFKCMKK
jgi:hypothetical protein